MTDDRAGSDGTQRHIPTFLEALTASGGRPLEQMTPMEARAGLVGVQSSASVDLPKAEVAMRTITSDGQTVKLVIVRPPDVTSATPAQHRGLSRTKARRLTRGFDPGLKTFPIVLKPGGGHLNYRSRSSSKEDAIWQASPGK
jgi:hypothetical protein